MEIKIALAKIDREGTGTSGDTIEVTERPNGGISIVLADGKIDGRSSKAISTLVTHRVLDPISEGVRDGASIRAAAKSIFEEYKGSVIANLSVISADLQTDTVIVSRNHSMPVFLISEDMVDCLSSESEPIGSQADASPTIIELPIQAEMALVIFSDGVFLAGQHSQQTMDICTTIGAFIEEQEPTAQEIADFLLKRAIRLDGGHPKDDMSVIVLLVSSRPTDTIRRMNISLPLI
jgi:serine phosphatase RsbU (regulator of sigma subunit)